MLLLATEISDGVFVRSHKDPIFGFFVVPTLGLNR